MARYAEVTIKSPYGDRTITARYTTAFGRWPASWNTSEEYVAFGDRMDDADAALRKRYGAENVRIYERP